MICPRQKVAWPVAFLAAVKIERQSARSEIRELPPAASRAHRLNHDLYGNTVNPPRNPPMTDAFSPVKKSPVNCTFAIG